MNQLPKTFTRPGGVGGLKTRSVGYEYDKIIDVLNGGVVIGLRK